MAENFHTRGLGLDGVPCMVCGGPIRLLDNIAAFVDDKEAGERVVAMFESEGAHARLDYRPSEPNWVQVKTGACETHKPNLEYLDRIVRPTGTITPTMIRKALRVTNPSLGPTTWANE